MAWVEDAGKEGMNVSETETGKVVRSVAELRELIG